MKKGTFRMVLTAAALLAAVCAGADGLHGDFSVRSGDYSVHFSPRRAYQMDQISFQGQIIATNNGNYGFMFHGGDMKFVGGISGEQVLQTRLAVDGREVAAPAPAEVDGVYAEFATESLVRGIRVFRRVIVTPAGIQRNLVLQVEEDTYIGTGYAFMVCGLPTTTEWTAQLKNDSRDIVGGLFNSQGLLLRDDASRVAIYEPALKIAMVSEFSPDNLPGKDIRHCLQDLPTHQYHKLYYQPFSRETLKAGERYSFDMTVRGLRAEPDGWKSAVTNMSPIYRPVD